MKKPDPIRQIEDQFLDHVRAKGIPCGHLDRWGWVWVRPGKQEFHINIRSEMVKNIETSNGSVPLHIIRQALLQTSPKIFLTHFPEFKMAKAGTLLKASPRTGRQFCCDYDHGRYEQGLIDRDDWCPERERQGLKDRPFLIHRLSAYKPSKVIPPVAFDSREPNKGLRQPRHLMELEGS